MRKKEKLVDNQREGLSKRVKKSKKKKGPKWGGKRTQEAPFTFTHGEKKSSWGGNTSKIGKLNFFV